MKINWEKVFIFSTGYLFGETIARRKLSKAITQVINELVKNNKEKKEYEDE